MGNKEVSLMEKYVSPFTISSKMLELVGSIMEKIGKLDNFSNLNKMPVLRRNNRIHSIHSSLAIEANSLSYSQVKDVINGKMVLGEQKEIQEVKNAYRAYEMMSDVNPYNIEDLLKTHGVMTYLTVKESGVFRKGEEGVFDENGNCIFIAPKPEYVEALMNELFEWMLESKDELHPLILSCIFHYEFVFIHPFSDGNGRMARLWQNIILAKWKEIFEYVPVESQIKKYQNEYYVSINNCNKNGNSNEFIEFMLKMIDKVLEELLENTQQEITHISGYVTRLLEVMDYNVPMTAFEIMGKLGLKSKISFRDNYLNPALDIGLIKMTLPNKPTSKNQMYYRD